MASNTNDKMALTWITVCYHINAGLTLMNDEKKGESMTNDFSKTITNNAPAPEVGNSASKEGKAIPLPVTEGGTISPAPDAPPPDMIKTIGGTTFDIYFHFSQTSRETFTDKVLRLIQSDTVTSKK